MTNDTHDESGLPDRLWIVDHPDIENAKVGDEVTIIPVALSAAPVEGVPVTAATLTLTEFLLARIAEEESRVGQAASAGAGAVETYGAIYKYGSGNVVVSPSRFLAECEAKRRLVEMFVGDLHEKWDDGHEAGKMAAPILGTLAAVYADHPDYRDEWRP